MRVCSQTGAYIRVRDGTCVSCPKGCQMNSSLKAYMEARRGEEQTDPFTRCRNCASSEKGILTGQLLCNEQPNFHPVAGGCEAFIDRRGEAPEEEPEPNQAS